MHFLSRSFFIASLMTLAFLGAPAMAAAQTASEPQRIDLDNGQSVFFTTLAIIQGLPGESQDLVVNRAARAVAAFTQETQLEACGDITIGPEDALRIVIGTIHAHIGCVSSTSPDAGYRSTGMSIHSHPTRRGFIVNVADVASNSVADTVFEMLHVGRAMTAGERGRTFSATDLRESMSYLVADGHLLFQVHGKVYDRGAVALLPTSAPTAVVSAR